MDNDLRQLTELQRRAEFTHIPPDAAVWRKALHLGTRLKYAKGEEILHGGEYGRYMYFVDQGEVWLLRTNIDGREKILMSMREDSIIGETPFFDEVPTSSTIFAASDCILYAFSRQCVLQKILPQHPELVVALLRSLASKVRVLCNQSVSLSLDDLASRICRFLRLRMMEEDTQFVVPQLNQQELANLLGVHRVTLNKSLRELERARILGPYSKDEIYILDMERFMELASV